MTAAAPAVVCLAGFGDSATMYEPLRELGLPIRLVPTELPGFGGTSPRATVRTVEDHAEFVARVIAELGSPVGVVAHSVASVVAALAVVRDPARVVGVASLEGNLTTADAYFSGSAADYDDPESFVAAFDDRLAGMARSDPILQRYRATVATADPGSLWALGCSARRVSRNDAPGSMLLSLPVPVRYLYNPENCPPETLEWLDAHDLDARRLPGVSHWPTIDAPATIASELEVFFRPLFDSGGRVS